MDVFYENLQPYGSWREIGNYGYCWQPLDVRKDWSPYSDGRWVYTDAGWTWDSYEPFGWAVYHYGRWVNVGPIGWVWVPGTEWGPGWVSWRHSPQFVGWAPLPPEALFLRIFGLSSWVDAYYDIGPSNYRFVENRNFGSRRLQSVFIDQRQNVSMINQTTNITNITYVNNVVHNGGLVYDQQSRQSALPIERYKLERRQALEGDPLRQTTDQLRSRVVGDSLSMIALPFSSRSTSLPRKLADKIGDVEVNRGWKNVGSNAEIAEMRARLKSKDKVPDGLPPEPKFELPEGSVAQRDPRTLNGRLPDERLPTQNKQASNPRPERGEKPGRPDMPPATPNRTTNPAERPAAIGSVPKGDRGEIPTPEGRTPFLKPNPGGRNKMDAPQLPRTKDRPFSTVAPKGGDRERMPQITPRESKPSPDKPKMELPKAAPVQSVQASMPPQVIKPVPPAPAPPNAVPPKPDNDRGTAKPNDRKKKKDE